VVPPEERDLVVRLLSTLLREDVAGLRTRGRPVVDGLGGGWLALGRLRIPVRWGDPASGDLLCDLAVRSPFVLRTTPGRRIHAHRLHAVLTLLARELPAGLEPGPADELRAGFAALRREAVAALAAARLRRRRRPSVFGRLRPELAGRSAAGWPGAIGFETLAAHRDHPLYPFSLARVGLPVADLPRVAPEHGPDLELSWLVLPSAAIEQHGRLPDWWPVADGTVVPVHPAVRPSDLRQALIERGIEAAPIRASVGSFRPTLSLRTVVAARHPHVHLKLPMPVRTLGRLNLRTITRRGLADGVLVGGLVRAVLRREPEFQDVVQVADESSWLHAGHPLLAVLDRFADGDLDRLLRQYLRLTIGWHVALWLRHGIVLEAHPQNVLIAVDTTASGPRIRLLLRDLDSAKFDLDLLAAGLGAAAPTRADLADQRLAADDPRELLDLFVTTTLHQCVAAVLLDLARALGRPARPLLDLIRPLLVAALAADPQSRHGSALKHEILEVSRLPVKRALTAATLLPKTRTGAADVNKYYGADAPSYL
jgi:siderophore synthetase component